jgi:hypothetical protein
MITSFFITIVWAIGIFIATANHVAVMQIVISNEAITGPSLWFNRRVQFPVKDLDKEKSCRLNFFQRILGYRLIQSKTGQKILFAERTFDKNQASMILDTLGYARSGIA